MISKYLRVALCGLTPLAAVAQDAPVPDFSTFALPASLCALSDTCLKASDLGLPRDMPTVVVTDWGAAQLKSMAGVASPEMIKGYAKGMSDTLTGDWCNDCSCCILTKGAVTFGPETLAQSPDFGAMIVIMGQ